MSDCPKCLGIPGYDHHTCGLGAPDDDGSEAVHLKADSSNDQQRSAEIAHLENKLDAIAGTKAAEGKPVCTFPMCGCHTRYRKEQDGELTCHQGRRIVEDAPAPDGKEQEPFITTARQYMHNWLCSEELEDVINGPLGGELEQLLAVLIETDREIQAARATPPTEAQLREGITISVKAARTLHRAACANIADDQNADDCRAAADELEAAFKAVAAAKGEQP